MLQAILINSFFALSTIIASSQLPTEHVYGPDPLHKLDVYLPNKPDKAPVIVMLHGGAWQSGDKRGPAPDCRSIGANPRPRPSHGFCSERG